jgi:hypothetical protein
MIKNLDGFLGDSSSDEFNPIKHYANKENQNSDSQSGLNLYR